ncbi:exported protein of unknown function [Candidatus Nitrospira inopinata]|uniref:Uncharacterized protein n=1 Tax=Candidatus Nitrospira inopinata TaxID=1715989 RepID=A0A0S4KTA0_9BACT|nr:exported protein of unknown function [Candidatus Nitrospira inopinata]
MGGATSGGAALVNHAAFSATPDIIAGDISHRMQVIKPGCDPIALFVGHTDVMCEVVGTFQR